MKISLDEYLYIRTKIAEYMIYKLMSEIEGDYFYADFWFQKIVKLGKKLI